jgi:hypothetical protein
VVSISLERTEADLVEEIVAVVDTF